MADDRLQITPQEVTDAATKVEEYAANYKKKYEDVLKAVEEFTTTDFKGDAADAFRNKVEDFTDDFQKMKELVDEYAAFMKKAANEWVSTSDNLISQIGQLKS